MKQIINSEYLACVWKDVERRIVRGPPSHSTSEERERWNESAKMFLEYVKYEFERRLEEEVRAK
jgi:hypothetical protein